MAKRLFVFAVIAIALATSTPVRGQSNTPTAVISTVTGVTVGLASDGTVYRATLYTVNASAPASYYQETFLTPAGKLFAVWTDGSPAQWIYGPIAMNYAKWSSIAGFAASTPAASFNISTSAAAGVASVVVVEQRDATGKLVSDPVAMADPALVAPAMSASYGLPRFLGPTRDTKIRLTNETVSPVNVVIGGYDNNATLTGRVTVVTTIVTVPPAQRQVARATVGKELDEKSARMPQRLPQATLIPGTVEVALSDFPDFVTLAGDGTLGGVLTLNYVRLSASTPFGASASIEYKESGDQQRSVPVPLFPAGGVAESNAASSVPPVENGRY